MHATVLKENAENARILAKILPYTVTLLMKGSPLLRSIPSSFYDYTSVSKIVLLSLCNWTNLNFCAMTGYVGLQFNVHSLKT